MKKHVAKVFSAITIIGIIVSNFNTLTFAKTVSDSLNLQIKTVSSVIAPIIIAENITISVGQEFNPLNYATAYDSKDGDLTHLIKIEENTVDTKIPGVYKVVYKVTNSQEATTIKTIIVTVEEVKDDNDNNNNNEENNNEGNNNTNKPQTGDFIFNYELIILIASLGLICINIKDRKISDKKRD